MFDISIIEKNIVEKFCYFQNLLSNMTVTTIYGPLLIDSGLKSDMFNVICCTGNETKQSLDSSIQHFREKELPFCWWVGFENDPLWVSNELNQRGLKSVEKEMVMATHVDSILWPIKNENIICKHVRDEKGMNDFLFVMNGLIPEEEMNAIRSFYEKALKYIISSNSSIHFIVGYHNRVPVGTCSVFYSHGVSSIFDVMVTPNMRGQGIGKTVTCSGMELAAKSGFNILALTATNDAKFMYEKLGFHALKLIEVYV